MGEHRGLTEKTEELLRQSRELIRSIGERLAEEDGAIADSPEEGGT
jgi:hypothetical protein